MWIDMSRAFDTVKHSSLLQDTGCSSDDIRRVQYLLSTLKGLLLTRKKISLESKLKLDEVQVVSVMLYNANSWSPTTVLLKKRETTDRQHLRTRSDENTPPPPPQLALSYSTETNDILLGRLGRPSMNLFSVLVKDLDERNLVSENRHDLNEIQDIAMCRKCWKNRFWAQTTFRRCLFKKIIFVRSFLIIIIAKISA